MLNQTVEVTSIVGYNRLLRFTQKKKIFNTATLDEWIYLNNDDVNLFDEIKLKFNKKINLWKTFSL